MPDAGAAIAEVLASGGVRRCYTVPGESFLQILDGIHRHNNLRLLSTRHESGASFMGDADAKVSSRPAVVAATRGVGAANLAIGVHTALQDSTPMVVLLGQVDTGFLGREGFQEIDLPAFYAPITKWAVTAHRTDRIPELIAKGLRISQTGRPGPVMIAFPADVLGGEVTAERVQLAQREVAARREGPAADVPSCDYIARRLCDARAPVIIAGGGARHSREELRTVAEAFSVGVYAAFRRQDVIDNDHPLYLGHLGLGVNGARLDALREADVVLVLGSRLSEITTSGYRLPGPTSEVIQVDAEPSVIGSAVPLTLGLIADVRSTLVTLLGRHPDDPPPRDWKAARRAFEDAARVPASRSQGGVDTAQVIAAMARVLPADTIVANDAGNFSAFLHTHWMYRAACSQVAPTSGAMGYGLPGAIGAKLAAPQRTVVGVAGDGGFSMSAMEIETAVRESVDVTMLVLRNRLQGTIAMHQARTSGRLAGVEIGEIHAADLARSLGAVGYSVTSEDELSDAIREAVRVAGPSVVDVVTDPEVITPSARLSRLLER